MNDWQTAPVLYVDFVYGGKFASGTTMAFSYDLTYLNIPTGETEQDFIDALDAARASWNDSSGVNLTYDASSSNEVIWHSGSGGGAWALTTWSFDGSGDITGADIHFYEGGNNFSTIPQSGHGDVESIALHEFGHAFGLRHAGGTHDGSKVMNGLIPPGGTRRTLLNGDIRGATWIYGGP